MRNISIKFMKQNEKVKIFLSIGLGLLCILLLSLALTYSETGDNDAGMVDFLGRFHPLIVHFPIVLILLSLIGEGINRWKKEFVSKNLMDGLLLAAILSSLLSAFLGYFLFSSGEYAGELVENHLWGGIWLALLISATGIAHLFDKFQLRFILLIASNLLLMYTGHLGGSLTHGENYLSEYFTQIHPEDAPVMQKSREELEVFSDLIIPLFQAKCLSCHNEHKAKGGLRMDTYAHLMAGGKSGKKMLDSLNTEAGELFTRIHLPVSAEEHMPPSGKAQLSEEELRLLTWWLESGAHEEERVGSQTLSPIIDQAIDKYLPRVAVLQATAIQKREANHEIAKELIPLAESLGFVIEPDAELDSFHYALSMKLPPETITDESLIELLPFSQVISRISLISSGVTDEGLYTLSRMAGLRKIVLAKTCVKGSGLPYLADIPNLEVLNLSDTFVDNLGAMELSKLKQVKEVYLLNSEVDLGMVEILNKFLPESQILMEEGPLY